MFKNVASQKIALFAFDTTTGAPKTGDSANITPYVSKDYGTVTVLGTVTATEMDATNAKGWYSFTLAQAETNGDALLFTGKSSTANVSVVGVLVYTLPANFSTLVVDGSGRVDVSKISGTSQTARDIGASVLISSGTGTGQLSVTSGVIDANATKLNGTALTARDIGASVLLSAGTGTGQIDFTSGVVKANVTQFGGSAGTFASGIPTVSVTSNVKKNQALAGFTFIMTDSTNHNPATGKTVTAQRSLAGAAFGSCTNSVTEVANGLYTIDLAAGDLNGNTVDLRFSATGCDDLNILIITQP